MDRASSAKSAPLTMRSRSRLAGGASASVVGDHLGGLDQDVPRARLAQPGRGRSAAPPRGGRPAGRCEGRRAAQHRRSLARLQAGERVGEQLRQAVEGTPAEVAPLQRVGRIGDFAARRAKSSPARSLAITCLARARTASTCWGVACSGARTRMWAIRTPRRGTHLGVGEEVVDLGVAHLDAVVDLALAQPRDENLLANVLAKVVPVEVLALKRLPERTDA